MAYEIANDFHVLKVFTYTKNVSIINQDQTFSFKMDVWVTNMEHKTATFHEMFLLWLKF